MAAMEVGDRAVREVNLNGPANGVGIGMPCIDQHIIDIKKDRVDGL